MKKIPTMLERDPGTHKVKDTINPSCKWVFRGEGIAYRKWNGTCVKITDDNTMLARREVKPDQEPPEDFIEEEHDPNTGKTFGWVPVGDGPEWRWHHEGYKNYIKRHRSRPMPRETFELIGPKVNGNPDKAEEHVLKWHKSESIHIESWEWTVSRLKELVRSFASDLGWEGIVVHHPDGRMAKLKERDLP